MPRSLTMAMMYGVVEFYKTAKAADINPVIGCEIYVAPNSRFDRETSHGGGPVLPSDPACGKQYRAMRTL